MCLAEEAQGSFLKLTHIHTQLAPFVIFGVFCFFSALQKQSKDRFGLEGDEESTMLEESVSPKKYVNL